MKNHRVLRRKILPLYYQKAQNPWLNVILYLGKREFAPQFGLQSKIYYFIEVEKSKIGAPAGSLEIRLDLQEGFHLPFLNESIDLIICHNDGALDNLSILAQEFERVLTSYGRMIWTFNNVYRWKDRKRKELSIFGVQTLLSEDFDIIEKHAHFLRIKKNSSALSQSLPAVFRGCFDDLCCLFGFKITIFAIKKSHLHPRIPLYTILDSAIAQ